MEIRKIAIVGYSGAGKSTLAATLGRKYGLDVLHFDRVQFLPGWAVRPAEEKLAITEEFLDTHSESGWVIDGNYTKLCYDRRMSEADEIIFLNFNRVSCFLRAWKRYRTYNGRPRESMAPGCNEKFDAAFMRWILWKGRTRDVRGRFRALCRAYPDKVTVIRSQRGLDRYYAEHGLTADRKD